MLGRDAREHIDLLDAGVEVGIRHLGAPEPQSPRAPGPLAFSEHAYVREILVAAGFTAVEVERVATTLPCAATAADEAGFASSLGPAARLIRLAEPDQATVAALVADLSEALEPYQTETGIELPATVFLVIARRG